MENIEVSDARTLIIKLNQLSITKKSLLGSTLWEILDIMDIYNHDKDLSLIDEEFKEKDYKKFDESVIYTMKVINPDCKDPYNEFLSYFTDHSMYLKLLRKVQTRINENWENISKVFHKYINKFDNDIMYEIVQKIYNKEISKYSIGSIELDSLFTENHISQDSSFIEHIYCSYHDRVKENED
jgi:hypothetical protein